MNVSILHVSFLANRCFAILAASCVAILSCNESVYWQDYSPSPVPIDKYSSVSKKGYPFPFETFEKIHKQLHLYSIENGFDSFQLRISIVDSRYSPIDETGYAVIISCNKNRIWKASCTRYDVAVVDFGVRLNAKSVKSLVPNYWPDVGRKIAALSINSWLGSTTFPYEDYRVGNSDNLIVVEYSTASKWRRVVYVAPHSVECNLAECKQVEELLKIMITEFGLVEFSRYL